MSIVTAMTAMSTVAGAMEMGTISLRTSDADSERGKEPSLHRQPGAAPLIEKASRQNTDENAKCMI